MRLAIFGTGPVGLEVVRLTRERSPEPLVLLGLDPASDPDVNQAIMTASPVTTVVRIDGQPDPATEEVLVSADLDLILLVWWPYIIHEALLSLPRLGCLNFHPSLLPHNRGKDPNFWALVERRPYGVTLHFADGSIDGGDIAYQRELPVTWEDTGETLYHRGQAAMVDLYKENLEEILSGEIPRSRQPAGGSFRRRCELDPASELDLDAPTTGRAILNLLRARTFRPHPGAWFVDDGCRYEARISIERSES